MNFKRFFQSQIRFQLQFIYLLVFSTYNFVFRISDAGEREPIVASDPIYIETTNHDDRDYQNDADLFCPASPTTVPVSAIKSRSNSGMHFNLNIIYMT